MVPRSCPRYCQMPADGDETKWRRLAYMFIRYDLKVVRALASEIIVMCEGKVVESGPAQALLAEPQSAYTRALFAPAFDIKAENGASLEQ